MIVTPSRGTRSGVGAATKLAMQTQPAGATAATPFTTQPAVRLQNVGGGNVAQSNVTVTVAKHAGVVGTLSGTLTAVTDGSGIATFTDLQMSAAESGVTLDFTSGVLTGVTSASFTVAAGGGIGTLRGHAPGYANTASINFSQDVPTGNPNIDNPIVGASPWNAIYMATDGPIKDTDATAPGSGPSTWRWHWAAGDYSGGGGHGFGNFFVNMRSVMGHDAVRLYASVVMKFSASWVKHPISNKWFNLDTDGGVIVIQWNEGNTDWFPMDELVSGGSYLTCNISNNAYVPDTWEQVEVLIDFTADTLKIWRQGVLVSSRTNYNWASTLANTIGWNQFRGGGGEILAASFEQVYDDVYIEFE